MNTQKQTILFYVVTEYQLYLAINIILSEYADSSLFHRVIIQSETPEGRFSKLKIDTKQSFVDQYHTIWYNPNDFSFSRKLKHQVDSVLPPTIHHFFFFGGGDYISKYLIYKFGNTVLVSRSEDGLREYMKYEHTLEDNARNLVKSILFSISKQMMQRWYTIEIPSSVKFHRTWLTRPEILPNQSSELRRITISNDIALFKGFFCEDLPALHKCVVFFNQPIGDERIIQEEISLLDNISKLLRQYNKKLVIKLHPLSHKRMVERYSAVDNVELIEPTILAALFMNECTNSIFVSWWSSVLLNTTPSNQNIWMFRMLEKKGIMKKLEVSIPNDAVTFEDRDALISFIVRHLGGVTATLS